MQQTEPTIRRYSPGEESILWQIYFEATWQCIARDYHADLCERWAPHDKDMAGWSARVAAKDPFVAVVDGRPVAFAELEPDGHIDYFYCLPKWQGRGIGNALLRRIEDEARRLGLPGVFAEVSLTAKTFFLGQGFIFTEACENTILGHPAPNFCMEKGLA